MSILQLKNITVIYGNPPLLDGVELVVQLAAMADLEVTSTPYPAYPGLQKVSWSTS